MLKLKNLIENDQIASQLLKKYPWKEVKYGFCRSSSNVVYWVHGDGKLYFLRYTTVDERTKNRLEAEVEYILYLIEQGVNANQPVKTKEGSYIIEYQDYLGILFEGVPGKPLEDIELSTKIARGWGRQLGKLHELSAVYMQTTPSHKRSTYKEVFQYIDSILDNTKDTKLISIAKSLEATFDQLPQTIHNYGLCHYDLELDNVFYQEEDDQFFLIDFDDSMYHFYAIDFVQILMNIEEDIPLEMQSWVRDEFIKGYQEFCSLPSEIEISLAKKFVVLLGYARLTYSLSNPPEVKPDWMDELIKRLRTAQKDKYACIMAMEEQER